jgi:type II secretion system protein G
VPRRPPTKPGQFRGFTLIELLIVVAIIAILAAIAVPNFLEAQTRSKVARVLNDFRTIATGLESYRVDNNKYPETDLGLSQYPRGQGLFRLTTPISYLSSVPTSPFSEKNMGAPSGQPKHSNVLGIYLHVRKYSAFLGSGGEFVIDQSYERDRAVYLAGANVTGAVPPGLRDLAQSGEWFLKSVGPNNFDDREDAARNPVGNGAFARIYDATNGTVSDGDIVTFSDRSIAAQQGR